MKLRLDVRPFLGPPAPELPGALGPPALAGTCITDPHASQVLAGDVDLRRLPWPDGHFAAIELDDVPDPDSWPISGPALSEVRRVLKRHGLLELRTRREDAAKAQATSKAATGALTRLLQNHGFEVVSVDAVEDSGSMLSAIALRGGGPDDVFEEAMATPASHVTLHAPMLDAGDDAAAHRALAVTLDAQGVKVRVRVIFDVLDALACD